MRPSAVLVGLRGEPAVQMPIDAGAAGGLLEQLLQQVLQGGSLTLQLHHHPTVAIGHPTAQLQR